MRAVLNLLSDKATIPFIARYRKELTGALDEVALRHIDSEHKSLQELWKRKQAIRNTLQKQQQLSEELERRILGCTTRAELEALYLPFKMRRRTRAQMARERGLTPLAERILAQPLHGAPEREAQGFVDPKAEVTDTAAALQGACDIVAEVVAARSDVRALCRETYRQHGVVRSLAIKKVASRGPTKFEQYYDHNERIAKIPSHRYLAIRRGVQEGVLRVKLMLERPEALLERIFALMRYQRRSPFAELLRSAISDGFNRLLESWLQSELAAELKARSEAAAIEVFAENLRHLLLAAPLGMKSVLGIDPGFRTGCKCAVVDPTGKLLAHATIYPTGSSEQVQKAGHQLMELVGRYAPAAVAIGNGTAGRPTFAFVATTLRGCAAPAPVIVSVNEAGASVYSASEVARREFPDLDLTLRGAISIARRLQDPLAELVKIEPQAIGVGQYQHDVSEAALLQRLSQVVESAVNFVGVELNTASAALLSHVAGIGSAMAQSIVSYRDCHGPFAERRELMKVDKLGPKTFEQAAGFLRIRDGRHPLDASAVHPERYEVVNQMARHLGVGLEALIGNPSLVDRLELERYVDEAAGLGLLTLRDIASELKKPGRDPRSSFDPPKFRDDIQNLEDLKPGMHLDGIVTNVTAFGAFVDVGVHQDGLVHVSELAQGFVKSPASVVSVGDSVRVRVMSVDLQRKRIALSAKPEPATKPS